MAASVQDKLAQAQACRAEGNALFSSGRQDEAMFKWHEVLMYVRGLDKSTASAFGVSQGGTRGASGLTAEHSTLAKELTVVAHVNLAAGLLRKEKYERAAEACSAALELEPDHQKALFRRAKALLALRNSDAAAADLDRVEALDSGNADARALRRDLACLRNEEKRSASAVYAKMFVNKAKIEG